MISDSWMQELMSKTDIVSVIGEYTTLTPKGGKLWACCPFHHEKTPSFKVDPTTQLYYCFGCHKGGNVITFLKEKENMSGYEALRTLAERAGMEMPDSPYSKEEAEKRRNHMQRLYNANRDAARFYYSCLQNSEEALSYLHGRGLSDSIITRFGLGFAPNSWTGMVDFLHSKDYTDDEIIAAGLAKRSDNGKVFDFFRNRIIFPIIDEKSNVLAFGGRTMGDDKPKYLNTGDTPIYNKRNNVYALNMLKKGTLSDIIIVEGYMDVISLFSVGIENAVATLGTALTENQARLLKRRTTKIYVSYDGDSAGQNATFRGLDILASEGLEVRVIHLPDGLDPDDFARKKGANAFLALKDKSMTLPQFKIEHTAEQYDLTNPDDRQAFAVKACNIVCRLQPVEQERYYNYISQKTGISAETLKAQGDMNRIVPQKRNNFAQIRNNREKAPSFALNDSDKADLLLAACSAASGKAAEYIAENALDLINRKEIRSFVSAANDAYKNTGVCDIALILDKIEGDVSSIAASVFEQHIDEPLRTAKDCINRINCSRLENELMQLSLKLDTHEISHEQYKKDYAVLLQKLKLLKSN